MAPPLSQTSPSSSPSLKRKQPTIASFFARKPTITGQSLPDVSSSQGDKDLKRQETVESGKTELRTVGSAADGSEEDIIIAPAPKRLRVNESSQTDTSQTGTSHTTAVSSPPRVYHEQAPQLSCSQRTKHFKFTGLLGPGEPENDKERKRDGRKEELHRKFVRKLGGPDCGIGIGRTIASDVPTITEDGAEDDEYEEPSAPAKGRNAAKKGKIKLTPMERQVIDIKRKHTDTILVIEVGYKFRFFGEDARVAARELGIVCIPGKLRYDEHPSEAHLDRFASASIPVHRLHVHVKRLITAGHKVGVVRQIETAALKAAGDNRNTPFVRKLTNLYTKGTYIDDIEGLEGPAPVLGGSSVTGYILCITESSVKGWTNDEKVSVGIIAVQPATGDIMYDDFEDGFMRSEIETRLLHIAPCELLIVGGLSKASEKLIRHLSGSRMNTFGDTVRVERTPREKTAAVESHNHVSKFYASKVGLVGAADDAQASGLLQTVLTLPEQVTICLSAMIEHMSEYGLEHIFDLTNNFQHFSARSYMLLNGNTLVNLEIYQNQTDQSAKGSLFWALDRTQTRFGQRLLRKWVGRPLLDKSRLRERVDAVEELKETQQNHQVERIKSLLRKVKNDLERSLIRIYYRKCMRPELLTVLQTMQVIASEFSDIESPEKSGFSSPIIGGALASLKTILNDVVRFLDKINMHAAKSDDKYSFFREAEETEEISEHKLGIGGVEHELQEHASEIAKTLGKKKVDYATVSGIEYLVEVDNSASSIKRVPASWIKVSGTRKLSRFHTPDVVRLLRRRDQHKEALAAACDAAYTEFLADIAANYQSLRDCIQSLATLDCLIALAAVASQPGYVKPEYTDHPCISVEQGRHPMVEQLLLESYVPNNIDLKGDRTRALLITGPNMGGKSSYVRQVALISIMGQIGSYVPAKSATLSMLDAVFARMGAFDNMLAGESTFMVELSETADILRQATPRSLVILDELGRGTSTHDGVAIAQSVLDYMVCETRSLTLFITHYQHLASMARSFPNGELRNVHMRFTESGAGNDEDITFLYEVGEGVAHRSYGLNVARLANLPSSLLDVARQKSLELEERTRRRRFAGLVCAVRAVVGGSADKTNEDLAERIIAGAEQL